MMTIKIQDVAVPALGFGTWRLYGEECCQAVRLALETGYRHIDTAQAYDNEAEIGAALAEAMVPRQDIFLTTKVAMPNIGRNALPASVEASLTKLGTDYVDLLLIHWPVDDVPFEEQLAALDQVRRRGQARLIGVSNFTVGQLREVRENLGFSIVNNQVEYHPYLSQRPVIDFLRAHDMFLTAYCPLARGRVNESAQLKEIAALHHKTPSQVTLRWLIQQGDVAAIPKAAQPRHIQENFNISDFTLSESEMSIIHALARPDGRLINPDWAPAWDK